MKGLFETVELFFKKGLNMFVLLLMLFNDEEVRKGFVTEETWLLLLLFIEE